MSPKHALLLWATAIAFLSASSTSMQAACCYFSAKNTDILQPAQKVFITWDPSEKIETFTVQPKFEGNAGRLPKSWSRSYVSLPGIVQGGTHEQAKDR
jgi:hypothetical protein